MLIMHERIRWGRGQTLLSEIPQSNTPTEYPTIHTLGTYSSSLTTLNNKSVHATTTSCNMPVPFLLYFFLLSFSDSTLLLARHLTDVSCLIGPSMPSGICMEIHAKIVQKRKKKPSCDREFLGSPTSIYRLTNHISV